MAANQANELPHDIKLIAAISRLIDLHQSRRESNSAGAYVPDIPERAGYFLTLGLVILDSLHEIELERGSGAIPLSTLASMVKKRVSSATDEDIEYCIVNLKKEREIHYGVEDGKGSLSMGRTWETTPLISVVDGFNQIKITENARLLMRVSSLRESWLYSDIDADRLIKAIERGQFNDIPPFCRSMMLDLATKNKQLSKIIENPSLSELRDLLLREGNAISDSLLKATDTIKTAIDLIFDERTRISFSAWASKDSPEFSLGNLQSELELVLQNVESLSRRFLTFVNNAQKVRHHGSERIRFLDIADHIVRNGYASEAKRLEALFSTILPAGISTSHFTQSTLIGLVDFKEKEAPAPVASFSVDPDKAVTQTRFRDFIMRNHEQIINRLKVGPLLLSDVIKMTDFSFVEGESVIDLFGIYVSPGVLENKDVKIVVGFGDAIFSYDHMEQRISGTNPIMMMENNIELN